MVSDASVSYPVELWVALSDLAQKLLAYAILWKWRFSH